MIEIPRRSFLTALGLATGGLALGSFAEAAPEKKTEPKDPKPITDAHAKEGGFRPNVFVHVASSGVVSIVCSRSEMGQGVRSSLPPLIADELGADMATVKVVQGDGDKVYGDQNTDGSRSVRMDFDKLRKVGAAARMMLVEAAARRWGVPASMLTVENSAVHHAVTKRTLGFGQLANDAASLPIPKDDKIVLRPRSEWKWLGKDLPLLDGPAIVRGQAVFGADVKIPGMLIAVIARPPVVGGKVARYDATRALAVPGVKKVVELPAPTRPFAFQPLGGLAVVADNTWAAMRGRHALDVTWDTGENEIYDSVAYRKMLAETVSRPGKEARNVGDAVTALANAPKRLEALYETPHLAHATMEPPVAIANVTENAVEIWAATQNPQAAKKEAARSLGLDESKITVHVTLLGGGFGRKSKADFVAEAVLVSKAMNAPVRVQWTREDDLQHDYYHSTSAQRLEAGIDAQNNVVAWRHRTAFPPISSIFTGTDMAGEGDLGQGVLDTPLAIPNVRAESCAAKAHVRIGWLRSVANVYHAFAIQSFIDELAHARGKDPRDNLLDLLGPAKIWTPADLGVAKNPNYGQPLEMHPVDTARHRRVLERVTELARWKTRQKDGRALGVAVHRSFLTYVACVVSVVRDPPRTMVSGKTGPSPIRVDEAWIVADAGTIVNQERVRSQLEGAVIFGLGHALYGAITMKNGATEQTNFRDFRLMRMPEAPRAIHTEVIPSEHAPGGIGEPGVPPVAPALTNAIFALTNQRVRALPVVRTFPV